MPEHRVELDFVITFRNGGGLQGQGFRLDIPTDDISDADAGALLVREPRLLMVDEVRITAHPPPVDWSSCPTWCTTAW